MHENVKSCIMLAGMFGAILIAEAPAQAFTIAPLQRWAEPAQGFTPTQVRMHRGGAVVRGPRGGAAVVGRGHYGGAVVRRGYGGAWVRRYRWAPGGAIAAGAAIGFVSAATAAAWASAPPQPGLCWYYTDPTQRNGFWDNCP